MLSMLFFHFHARIDRFTPLRLRAPHPPVCILQPAVLGDIMRVSIISALILSFFFLPAFLRVVEALGGLLLLAE